MSLWGDIDAVSPTRHQRFVSGGPSGGRFRRMTALDGDLNHGDSERAELGNSNDQLNSSGKLKTFFLYREGERRVTSYWMRLPTDFPINDMEHWAGRRHADEAVRAGNECGRRYAGDLTAGDRGQLDSRSSPAPRACRRRPATSGRRPRRSAPGTATSSSTPPYSSLTPRRGSFRSRSAGSRARWTALLQHEEGTQPGRPGLKVGDSIPSHLRLGIYHDPVMPGTLRRHRRRPGIRLSQ